MSIPIETRAEAAREVIKGLGLQDPGLSSFLGKVDWAMSRPSTLEQEQGLRFIEKDLARWAEIEKRR